MDDHSTNGFTLIEILIVVVIISIAVTFAALSVGGFIKARRVEMTAKELAALLPLVSQQAILQPAILGLRIESHRYAFYRFVINPNTDKGEWRLISRDLILKPHDLADNVQLSLRLKESVSLLNLTKKNNPQIIFLPSSDNTAFILLITNYNKPPRFQLTGIGNGDFNLKEIP